MSLPRTEFIAAAPAGVKMHAASYALVRDAAVR